jgi:hypothetical protein
MLEVTRRDDKTFTFYFFDTDGLAMDLTGFTLLATIKQSTDDLDAAAKISKELTLAVDPTTGVATLTIDAADTVYMMGNYSFDLQLVDDEDLSSTVMRDTFVVLPDVTIRIATPVVP